MKFYLLDIYRYIYRYVLIILLLLYYLINKLILILSNKSLD